MGRAADPPEPLFERIVAAKANALIVQGSLIRKEVADLAIRHRLASIAGPSVWAQLGGFATYTAHFAEMMRETAAFVAKILDGRKPAELPVAFPMRFELGINLKTAQAIGLEVPATIMGRADQVIE